MHIHKNSCHNARWCGNLIDEQNYLLKSCRHRWLYSLLIQYAKYKNEWKWWGWLRTLTKWHQNEYKYFYTYIQTKKNCYVMVFSELMDQSMRSIYYTSHTRSNMIPIWQWQTCDVFINFLFLFIFRYREPRPKQKGSEKKTTFAYSNIAIISSCTINLVND